MSGSSESPRKNCPRCGLEDAPFGRNKTRKDGLSAYCKMCMKDSRADSAVKNPPDWKAINVIRRSRPGYREKERKRANERDKERRKTEEDYTWRRSESNRKWRNSGDAGMKRDRANMLRRQKRIERQAARSLEDKEAARLRQKEGWKEVLRQIKNYFLPHNGIDSNA